MTNLHIEHPEDTILTGDLTVLDALLVPSHLSVKIDGAPAIVWGKHPQTNRFFVGTKSVFNKKLVKVNYNHDEIETNHGTGDVATILHKCLCYLPFTDNIYQGDFIGFGGNSEYTPNTITYTFDDEIEEQIIIAPHTRYVLDCEYNGDENVLRECVSIPLLHELSDSEECKFVQPNATYDLEDSLVNRIKFAKSMAQLVTFVDDKESKRLKKVLNECIKQEIEIDSYDFPGNESLIDYWLLIKSIKEELLSSCFDDCEMISYIEYEECDGEGYVLTNPIGTYKIIDREYFSHKNFTLAKRWDS